MKKKILLLVLLLLVVTVITGCATQSRNSVTGQAYQYTPPPQAGAQNSPTPQPVAQGYGCAI